MKKFYYSLFAAAAMLLATTSCSQEEDFGQQSSGELTSFSVKLENATGSRAVGDGTTATKLYYEVYRGSECIIDQNVTINTTASIEMPLLKGEKYDIIFWAQSANGIYKVENLKEITVDYQSPKANMEDYDAFYNALNEFTADGKTHTIELRRPFAQLNLGTSDWEKAKEGLAANGNTDEVPVTHTQVTVKGLATSFSPLTGIATGDAGEVTFAYNQLPSQEILTVDNVSYKYLSLNYLLVESTNEPQGLETYVQETAEGKTNVDLVFALKRGETALFELNIPNAPVQRNWRTNVVGALLTGSEFDVIIKPETDGNYGSADLLMEALKKGGEFTLPYNMSLAETVEVPEGVTVKLNLNGHTINGSMHKNVGPVIKNNGTLEIVGEGTIKSEGENGGSAIVNNGTMTVKGVTLNGAPKAGSSWPSYTVNNTGTLTIEDSYITSNHGSVASYGENAVVTLNSTDINMAGISGFTSHAIYAYSKGQVIVNGGDIANHATDQNSTGGSVINGAVTVNGGTFTGRIEAYYGTPVLKGGTYTVNPNTKYVAEGYKVIEKIDEKGNTLYYVVPEGTSDVVTISSVVDLAAFAANVNNGETFKDKTIVLAADLDLNHAAWTPIGDCTSGKYFQGTFDGQGYTISNLNVDKSTDSNEHSTAGLFGWVDAEGATIKNVKVDGATVKGSHWTGVIAGYFTGRIENCTVTNATVEGFNVTEDANGDKVGGIVGCLNEHSYINGNSVSKSTIKGNRDIGGIAGSVAASTYEMKDNTVTDVTITFITAKDYASAGAIVSGRTGYVADETNVATNVTIILNATSAESLAKVLTANDKNIEVVLQQDIDLPITSLGTQTGGSGEYKLGGTDTKNITIDLNSKKLNITTTYWSNLGAKNDDAIFTIKNGTMTSSQATGTWNSYDVTFSNCNYVIEDVVFEKAIAFANTGKSVSLKDVTINETHDYYAMWIEAVGQNVTIDGLNINSAGRGIKIDEEYVNEATKAKVTLNIKNSTFKTVKKAAIMVKSSAGATIDWLTGNDISAVEADKVFAVWVDADAKDYADKVVVNGALKKVELDENSKLTANTEGVYEISSASDLAILNEMMVAQQTNILGKNAKIKLTEDVDFTGFVWTPVDSHADRAFTLSEIDGNNKTISNLTINGQAMFTRFAGSGDVTIKNLTFDNATVTSSKLNTSILTVQSYQNVTLDNVDVKNSSITGNYKVAPLIATVYDETANVKTLILKNCDVENTIVKGQLDYMICGMVAWVATSSNETISFENCTVNNVTLQIPTTPNYNSYAYIHSTSGDADGSVNEADGVTVTNCKVERY